MSGSPLTESNGFTLRNATAEDYRFVWEMYVACMKPLLGKLGAWDEPVMQSKFDEYFQPREIKIIQVDSQDVGWLQVSETDAEINLDQIHLRPEHQSGGIGSRIIRGLMVVAKSKRKPLLLSLVRGNRAIALYKRLGFGSAGSDATKIHMRWEA